MSLYYLMKLILKLKRIKYRMSTKRKMLQTNISHLFHKRPWVKIQTKSNLSTKKREHSPCQLIAQKLLNLLLESLEKK